jgi:hypothetical protein
MNIDQATRSYEQWMRQCTSLVEADLRDKHRQMRRDLFLFFRGTFYRWAQLWPGDAPDSTDAPRVLAVGDLHIGSFGTWRDGEGRLAWGVDDFDEAYPLPYTNDLVRLATSVRIGIHVGHLSITLKQACDAIIDGYRDALRKNGAPLVLAEAHQNLRQFGFDALKPPKRFWHRLRDLPAPHHVPRELRQVFRRTLPNPRLPFKILRRRAGLGSLGQPRFVAIAQWEGGSVAREAKALVPSSLVWVAGRRGKGQSHYEQILARSIRAHDPFQTVIDRWLIRRISPEANPIELEDLPQRRDEEQLLSAMGAEAANVHLGSLRQRGAILEDLRRRPSNWLGKAAKTMAKRVEHEWRDYRS